MSFWIWLVVGFLLFLVLGFAALVIYGKIANARVNRMLDEFGEQYPVYILAAPVELYKPGSSETELARVLVIFKPESPELHSALESVNTLQELREREPRTQAEREGAGFVRDLSWLVGSPMVPHELTDGWSVYCRDLLIDRQLLPKGRLKLPYIYVKAIPSDPKAMKMIPYPDAD